MGASKPAGEQIVGFVAERLVAFCFRRMSGDLQEVGVAKVVRDPVGAFGGF
jgi:hypothetical protein